MLSDKQRRLILELPVLISHLQLAPAAGSCNLPVIQFTVCFQSSFEVRDGINVHLVRVIGLGGMALLDLSTQ